MISLCIIVPVLNEGATLGRCLDRLQALRGRGTEVVVVDGGSTDETWAIASHRADCVRLAPRGRASQMNAGARGATADVLLFLHADTVLPDDAVALIGQALEGSLWGRFDVRIDSAHPLLRVVAAAMNRRSRLTGIATGDHALFVRREAFEDAGGFPDIPLMEDIALSAALRRRSRPACIRTPVLTSARRWQRDGIVRTIALMWALRARFWWGADPQALADRYGYMPRPASAGASVAVLAKAPVPGQAKTRLARSIGDSAAARAQRWFTIETLRTVQSAALGRIVLWCAPDPAHRFFRALRCRTRITLRLQPDGDLGRRMAAIAEHHFALETGAPLLIVGTDCPVLAPGHLQEAARRLSLHDAVLIPAQDGGYVLLGLRRMLPQVFDGIAWSTPQVLAQTRARLQAAGATWCELEPLWDVDEVAEWCRYVGLRHGSHTPPMERIA